MNELKDVLDIERTVLDNGLVILVDHRPRAEMVALSGSFFAGAVFQPREKAGLSRFTAKMLMSGTESRSRREIIEGAESVGASIRFDSSEDLSSSVATCTPGNLENTLELLMDCIRNPSFPENEIEKVRGRLLTKILLREDKTSAVARRLAREMLYPQGNPYHAPLGGYEDSIQSIEREDLLAFWHDHYGPESMIISLSGNISMEKAAKCIGRYCEDWERRGERPRTPDIKVEKPKGKKKKVFSMMHKSQVDMAVMCQTIPRTHPDHHALASANVILGKLGLMGRLGRSIRGEEGMAYYATCNYRPKITGGYWLAYAGVNPQNTQKALTGIYNEMESISKERINEEEFEDCVTHRIGSLALKLETCRNTAPFLNRVEVFDLGMDYANRYEDLVRNVEPEDIRRVCERYLNPDASVAALAGPYQE